MLRILAPKEPTGTGKTRAMHGAVVEFIERRKLRKLSGCVVIAVPRLDLADEQARAIVKEFPQMTGRIRVWRGYGADDPDQPGMQMCHRYDDMKEVVKVKLRGSKLCKAKVDGVETKCSRFYSCGYQQQKRDKTKADIWLVAHELLTHQKPAAIKDPTLIVIDESVIDAFLLGGDGQYTLALDALSASSAAGRFWTLYA
jgi:hypothetical protein